MRWFPLVLLVAACDDSPSFFEPSVFYVEGAFAYDADTGAAVSYTIDGEVVDPTVAVVLASDDWIETYDDAFTCTVTLTHTGGDALPLASWVSEADTEDRDVWFGFSVPDTAEAATDCTDWDPSLWGEDLAATVASWGWGLGIAPLDPQVEETLSGVVIEQSGEEVWDESWVPAVFGAGFHWQGAEERFEGAWVPHDYAFAAEVDDDFALVFDEEGFSVPIPAADVADGPLSGAYAVRSWFGVRARLLQPTNL